MSADNLCGSGVPGELCITGDGLARGYLNQPELTAKVFVKNPFGEGMMYRTGDLARWLPDGNVEYLGRIDEQVKIRGFRIELGEIESRIREISTIRDCAVIVKEDLSGDKSIYAYYTSEEEVGVSEIRDRLSKALPEYMIPPYMMQIDAIPITRNGKLDKRALPEIEAGIEKEYVAPVCIEERVVQEVLCSVLRIESISVSEDLRFVGLNSIKSMIVQSKLRERGYEINVPEILLCENVEEIAKRIKVNLSGLNDDKKCFILSELLKVDFNMLQYQVRLLPVNGQTFRVLILEERDGEKDILSYLEKNNPYVAPHYILCGGHGFIDAESELRKLEELLVSPETDVQNDILSNIFTEMDKFSEDVVCGGILESMAPTPIQEISYSANLRISFGLVHFGKSMNTSALQKAIRRLVDAHDMLRATIRMGMLVSHSVTIHEAVDNVRVPFFDLSTYSPKTQQSILRDFAKYNERYGSKAAYKGETAPYSICVLKFNESDFYVAMPCSHLIFDGFSSELLQTYMNRNYESALMRKATDPTKYSYTKYSEKLREMSEKLTIQDIEETMHISTLAREIKTFLKIKLTSEIKVFKYSVVLKEEINGNELWNLAQNCLSAILEVHYQIEKVPILLMSSGRQYSGFINSECIGEHLDILPVLFVPGGENSSTFATLISDFSRKGINFLSILFGKSELLSGSVQKSMLRNLRPKILRLPVFNYLGMINTEFISLLKPDIDEEITENLNTRIIEFHMRDNNEILVSSFCEETKLSVLEMRMDEIFKHYKEEIINE